MNLYYCYSRRLTNFIIAMGMRYVEVSINPRTNNKYYSFEKSEKLDRIIAKYNEIKHEFDS